MSGIGLVIFDCDGVLMDSEVISAQTELSVYKKYGLEIDLQEFIARFSGSSGMHIMKTLEKELEFPASIAMLEEINAMTGEQCSKNAPMVTGVDGVLDRIEQPCCICSNSSRNTLKRMLSRVGLFERFNPHIFSAEDFDPPANKPRPDVIIKALREFETPPDATVLVEDSIHGVEAGIAAGVRVIGFTGASHTYQGHAERLVEAGAETTIRRMEHLPDVIRVFGQWKGLRNGGME